MKFNMIFILLITMLCSCTQVSKKKTSQVEVYKKNEFVSLGDQAYKVKGICPLFKRKKHSDLSFKRLKDFLNICVKQKKIKRVKEFSQVLLYKYKKSPWGYYYLSLAADIEKNYELALWMLDNAQNIQPSSGLFHYQRARIKIKMNDINGAMAEMQRAVQKDNKLIVAHLYIAQMYSVSLQYEKALDHFKEILSQNVNHLEANTGAADSYYFSKDYKKSLIYLDKAIRLKPDNLKLRVRRAEIFLKKLNDYRKALSLYKKIKILIKENKINGSPNFSLNKKIKEIKALIPKNIQTQRSLSSLKSKGNSR